MLYQMSAMFFVTSKVCGWSFPQNCGSLANDITQAPGRDLNDHLVLISTLDTLPTG